MRIIAGQWGGRRIGAPRGDRTRPTPERVREALFSALGPLDGIDVLDLFAGSGALALEALSRGARSAVAVDSGRPALAAIRANAAALGAGPRLRVVGRDWRAALAAEREAGRWYGVVLADPPYSLVAGILADLGPAIAAVSAPGATVVIEHASARRLPEPVPGLGHASRDDRTYGDTAVCILRTGGRP